MFATFDPQAKAQQQGDRLLDSEQNLQNKEWRAFVDEESYQVQLYEVNDIQLNSGFRLELSFILPVKAVPQGGQIGTCGNVVTGKRSLEFTVPLLQQSDADV